MAITTIVYEEKNIVTAGALLTTLHNSHVWGPKGQYFVRIPTKVIGMANKHKELSATANVAINMLRAVHMPENKKQNIIPV